MTEVESESFRGLSTALMLVSVSDDGDARGLSSRRMGPLTLFIEDIRSNTASTQKVDRRQAQTCDHFRSMVTRRVRAVGFQCPEHMLVLE